MTRIFSRIPSPIFTKKLKGTSETGGTKQDQEVSTEEAPFPCLFRKKGRIWTNSMKWKKSEEWKRQN
uniref:Uncharacterized protein n=1 Tax=Brassica oleracea TaxID=3712 RepID=A0A3P6DM59_BRAOL|nr:unnamed protein product [Brassica oleracea]